MSMCKGKRRYQSAEAARFFATTDGLRPYRCPRCGGFHLTSKRVGQARGRTFKLQDLGRAA
jgi:uncharacterized C2H2 Zn-finger protein